MKPEAKAKVAASVLGDKIYEIPFRASCFVSICKKRLNSYFSSKSAEAKQLARQGIE